MKCKSGMYHLREPPQKFTIVQEDGPERFAPSSNLVRLIPKRKDSLSLKTPRGACPVSELHCVIWNPQEIQPWYTNLGRHCRSVAQFSADNHLGFSNRATLQRNPCGMWFGAPSQSPSRWRRPLLRRAHLLPCAPPEPPPLLRLPPFPQRPSPHLPPTSNALGGNRPRFWPLEPRAPDPPAASAPAQQLRREVLAPKLFQSASVGFLPAPTKRPHPRSLIRTIRLRTKRPPQDQDPGEDQDPGVLLDEI